MNIVKNKLEELFNIRTREDYPAILLFIHSFFQGISLVFLVTASYALFLSTFNVKTLPYVYIISAAMIAAVRFVHSKIEQNISFTTLIFFKTGFILFSVEIFYLCLTGSEWVIMVLVIWHNVLIVFADLDFLGLAGRIQSLRQNRKFSGLASSVTAFASFIGGLSVPGIVNTIGAPNLLLISAFGILSCLFILLLITREFGDRFISQEEAQEKESRTLSDVLKDPYLKLVFCFVAFSVFGYYFLDYIFFCQLENCHYSENRIAAFLGAFFAGCSFLTLLSNVFLYDKIITRYGLGLITVPIVTAVGAALAIAAFFGPVAVFFWLITVIKLLDNACRYSFENPCMRILFLPLDRQVKSIIFSVSTVQPVALMITGFMLLLLTSFFSFKAIHLICVLSVILWTWIFIAVLLRRKYIKVLKKAIMKQRAGGIQNNTPGEIITDFETEPDESIADSETEVEEESPRKVQGLIDINDESLVSHKDDFDFDFDHDAETGIYTGDVEDIINFEDFVDDLLGDDETVPDNSFKKQVVPENAAKLPLADPDDNDDDACAFDPDDIGFEPLLTDEDLFGVASEKIVSSKHVEKIVVFPNQYLSDKELDIEDIFEKPEKLIFNTDKKIMILNSSDIFSSLPYKYLVKIASAVEDIHIGAGEEIVKKGDVGKSMYVIADGCVGVYDGERLSEIFDKGAIEEMAMLCPKLHEVTVKAIDNTYLLRLDEDMIYSLMAENIELVRSIIRVICKKA
ncbi:MAG: cyclic nucleotide-binding domain-containing protein [Desulfobacteraceae bacterium]|nr:cyclic nucleotide-binding domain-containing protein [Desulfobacteraceae bacterium]